MAKFRKPPRKKVEGVSKIPSAVVETVLEHVRAAEGAAGRRSRAPRRRESGGAVLRYEHPADLGDGEVVVLVLDRDMVVARTVHVAPASANPEGTMKERLDVAALRLAEMELVTRDVLASGLPHPDDSTITVGDEAELRRGGFDPLPSKHAAPDAVAQAKAEYAGILSDSMTVSEAARLLHVNESRIRQRLGGRSLFGIKEGGTWRIPRFQFDGRRTVRSLDAVLPVLPGDLHPVALRRWLMTPNPDLELGPEERAVSPLDWLAFGGEASQVIALAEAL